MSDEKGNQGNLHDARVYEEYNPTPIITVVTDLQKGFNSGSIAQAVQQVAQSGNASPGEGNTTPQTNPQTGGEKS